MQYFMPTRLFAEPNCVARHSDQLAALGASCLIVTDGTSARASGALDDVIAALDAGNVATTLWEGVTPNPPVAACIEAGRIAASHQAAFVVGIGGGSALDAAKAIAVFATNPALDEDGFYALRWTHDPLPIALVGTTAGTGSEVTKVSVLTDAARRKHSIHDDRLYAALSLGDARYTHTCPPAVTLSCGVDVLAHATESYFSHKADEVSRAFAIRAIRLAADPLAQAAVGARLSEAQRTQLYEASLLGGLAINTTGTCFPHNVGYYLTETYGVPHGFASAAFLPSMLELARAYDEPYADAFFDQVGMGPDAYADLVRACLPPFEFRMTADEVTRALPRWERNGSVSNTRADVSTTTIHDVLIGLFA